MRKVTVDNGVRCIPTSEKTKKKTDIVPKKIKAGSLPRKQNEKIFTKL